MAHLMEVDLAVIGGGPGGCVAAFLAADHGKRVALIDKEDALGGVCLRSGCIPSKALLSATQALRDRESLARRGIHFKLTGVSIETLRGWRNDVVANLSGAIRQLARSRKVHVVTGQAAFENSRTIRVKGPLGSQAIRFQHAIVATGSKPFVPKTFESDDPRVMTSAEALDLSGIPKRLLVIGAGYIGLELGTVYASLGSDVTCLEETDQMLLGADPDLIRPLAASLNRLFKSIELGSSVESLAAEDGGILASIHAKGERREDLFDAVLVAVGRWPNTDTLDLGNTAAKVNARGFIEVASTMKTQDDAVYAIGDVVGGALLAHKAMAEAELAVNAILGKSAPALPPVPAVVYTDPEIAWCGLTQLEARKQGREVKAVRFPWSASGRALTLDRPDGLTKLLVDPGTEEIVGIGIVGHGAGELIGEASLVVQQGLKARQLSECIHPHPSLSETLRECALSFYGRAPHRPPRRTVSSVNREGGIA